ncbi:MAG: ATP-binding protein [Bacteroidales bacterium]|nr:ATP-binding protein [Bacteroidales bacterium]
MTIRIAVASGKGGTGKTTVAINLYRAVNRMTETNALLVDCDVEEPNDKLFFPEALLLNRVNINQEIPFIDTARCTFCRKCVEYCEFNAIVVIPPAGFAEVNSSLCHSCGACLVACPVDAIYEQDEPVGTITRYQDQGGNGILEGRLKIGSTMQTMVIRSLKRAIPANENVVILDAPPGTSYPVVETISDADYIILVTEPTPFGKHDLKLMLALVREIGKPFGVVINKANLGNQDIYEYLREEEVEILSEIPFSKSYASQYARADLFSETPEDVLAAHQKIIKNLLEKGLIS